MRYDRDYPICCLCGESIYGSVYVTQRMVHDFPPLERPTAEAMLQAPLECESIHWYCGRCHQLQAAVSFFCGGG